jgi:hypothetical protein
MRGSKKSGDVGQACISIALDRLLSSLVKQRISFGPWYGAVPVGYGTTRLARLRTPQWVMYEYSK